MTDTPPAYGNISLQVSRLMHAACCRNHAELADLLEISQASITEALVRERIARDWEQRMLGLDISMDYVVESDQQEPPAHNLGLVG